MQFEVNSQQQPVQPTSYAQPKAGPPKWLFIVLGVSVLLGILLLILTIFTGGNPNADKLEQIVINNNEILRKIDANQQNFKTQDGANYQAIANAVVLSDGVKLTTFLTEEYGKKLDEKKQALAINTEHDDELAKTALGNTFDATFIAIIQEDLSQNLSLMQELINTTNNDSLRVLLQEVSNNQKPLL